MLDTRSERWGVAWARLHKVCMSARGNTRYMDNSLRNFSVHPGKVFRSAYESIQTDASRLNVSMDGVDAAIADMDMGDFADEPLGDSYTRAMQSELARQ